LPFGVRMAAGTGALLMVIGGGVAGVAALVGGDAKPRIVTAVGDSAGTGAAAPEGPVPPQPPKNTVSVPSRTSSEADRSGSRNPAREPSPLRGRPAAKAEPSPVDGAVATQPSAPAVVTTRTEVETREVPYVTRTVRDPGLPRGSKRVQTPGVAGEETVRYLVTLTDGKQTDRRLLDSTVTRPPQQEVIALGDRNDKADRCGAALDFCVPLGRDPVRCGHHRRDESGQISVSGNDLALLSGGDRERKYGC
jgi:hypothetical protein